VDKHKIVIAEDHTILREGLRALLSAEPDLQVVAEAGNGRDAIRVANLVRPNLVLIDITMPLTNGTEAVRRIKRRYPEIKLIVLTVHRTEEYIRAALEAGADGYVLKDDPSSELLHAIRNVLRDRTYLSPGISSSIVSSYLAGSASTSPLGNLTHREREVLKLIAEGQKNREIAGHLSVSLKTVEKHRSNLMKKLDLHSGPALTAYAFENGLAVTSASLNSAEFSQESAGSHARRNSYR
jgi:DNA-binding NarL/FixJ family response regulator